MVLNNKILILNTGGTFNKYYEPISGNLKVSQENNFINDIFTRAKNSNITIDGLLFKDSLEIDDNDRKLLVEYIQNSSYDKIIIVHGTDTMDQSADFIAKNIQDKMIVLTGAMKPYSIESVEAVSNLMVGYGYLLNLQENGTYIAMHGMVQEYQKIRKNRELGIFECQN